MSNEATFKINLKSGEIEIEGSEEFVERQVERLDSLIELLEMQSAPNDSDAEEGAGDPAVDPSASGSAGQELPQTFGEWLHSFRDELTESDKALITARFVQAQSSENDFKTSEVSKSLKDHGIKLSNASKSLKTLADRKFMFQTRRVGKLRFMRVSVDGQKHLEGLRREA